MAWTLGLSAAATGGAAALFAWVGARLWRRATEDAGDRGALRSFALWWLCVGASTACLAGMLLAGLAAAPSAALVLALRLVSLALLAVGLAGLLNHVAFVYTGRSHAALLGGLYAALGVTAIGLLAAAGPGLLVVSPWSVETLPARDLHPVAVPLVIAGYLVPPVVAAFLYLRLARRAGDAAQRRRILVLGGGILLWAASSLLARASDHDMWQFLTRVALGVLVAVAIAREFAPARDGRSLDDAALQRRIRDLV